MNKTLLFDLSNAKDTQSLANLIASLNAAGVPWGLDRPQASNLQVVALTISTSY